MRYPRPLLGYSSSLDPAEGEWRRADPHQPVELEDRTHTGSDKRTIPRREDEWRFHGLQVRGPDGDDPHSIGKLYSSVFTSGKVPRPVRGSFVDPDSRAPP